MHIKAVLRPTIWADHVIVLLSRKTQKPSLSRPTPSCLVYIISKNCIKGNQSSSCVHLFEHTSTSWHKKAHESTLRYLRVVGLCMRTRTSSPIECRTGRTKYLKCSKVGCDDSANAKIVGDLFFLGVCTYQFDFVIRNANDTKRKSIHCWRSQCGLNHVPIK